MNFDTYLNLLMTHASFQTQGLPSPLKIILQPEIVQEISRQVYQRHLDSGVSKLHAELWSRVGILYSDPYIYVLRDAVIFPDGSYGIFKRVVLKSFIEGRVPVAILPMTARDEVVLIKTWRHATQNWELEIPRGACEEFETSEQAAKRELGEETGMLAEKIHFLGEMCPDSGILNYNVQVYHAQVAAYGAVPFKKDLQEMIQDIIVLDIQLVNQAIRNGFMLDLNGKDENRLLLRDPFLTYALYQLKLKF